MYAIRSYYAKHAGQTRDAAVGGGHDPPKIFEPAHLSRGGRDPGSGKTKTLTSRLAYLIGEVGIDPASTLTLTFTNKAAAEMRERALKMMPGSVSYPPLLCTFHKFGLRITSYNVCYTKLLRKNCPFSL